jgi:hypothetical protein
LENTLVIGLLEREDLMPDSDEKLKKLIKDAEGKAKAAKDALLADAKLKTDPNREKKLKALADLAKVED